MKQSTKRKLNAAIVGLTLLYVAAAARILTLEPTPGILSLVFGGSVCLISLWRFILEKKHFALVQLHRMQFLVGECQVLAELYPHAEHIGVVKRLLYRKSVELKTEAAALVNATNGWVYSVSDEKLDAINEMISVLAALHLNNVKRNLQ